MIDFQALKDLILATPECLPYIISPTAPYDPDYLAKDNAIADILNRPQGTRLVHVNVTATILMSRVGALVGATILEKLVAASASVPAVKWAMKSLEAEPGVDFGDTQTQLMIDQLQAGGVLTLEEAIAMKAIGQEPSSPAIEAIGMPVIGADVSLATRRGQADWDRANAVGGRF
jgi:hypothetical protein